MPGTEILIASAWKGTILLAAACAASAAFRRKPASFRHFLWSAVFAGLLLLPPAIGTAPRWAIVPVMTGTPDIVPAPATAAAVSAHASASRKESAPVRWTTWLLWLWAAGMLASFARYMAGAVRTTRMARGGKDWAPGKKLSGYPVIVNKDVPVPMAWGIRKPVVLVPEKALGWPESRIRTVLLHEAEHIRRHDLAAQLVARAACSLYWFHPLAWYAWREFRKERERACDDAVLARGVAAHEYAGHLVDVLRETASRRDRWAEAPAVAEPSGFESRIRSVLDRGRNRNPLSRRAAAALGGAVLLCIAPVAMIHAQSSRAALAGVITDASGARIPGCKVVARSADGAREEVTVADAAGEYSFASIPSGEYALEFKSPGFAAGKADVTLAGGAAARADMQMQIGTATEQVTVEAQRTTPAPRITGTPHRIRVGGNVKPAKLIHRAEPVYSDELRNAGIEGTVLIRAVISVQGTVLNPTVINTVDSRLAKAALDAVSQWSYEPTMLNGQPVEMTTTILVDFRLSE